MIDWKKTAALVAVFAILSLVGAVAITGRWGGIVVDLRRNTSRSNWRPELEAGIFWPVCAVCFVVFAGGAIVLGSLYHKGRYTAETASWVQAAGTLLALLTAIIASQLTNTRLVRQQRNAKLNAFSDRIRAIHNLREAYAQAAGHVRSMTSQTHKAIKVTRDDWSSIVAANAVIDALLQHPLEIGADALHALSRAKQVHVKAGIDKHLGAFQPDDVGPYIILLDRATKELETIAKEATLAAMRGARRDS